MTTKRVDELKRGERIVLTNLETRRRSAGTITYVGERPRETVWSKAAGATVVAWVVFYSLETGGECGQKFAPTDRLEIA